MNDGLVCYQTQTHTRTDKRKKKEKAHRTQPPGPPEPGSSSKGRSATGDATCGVWRSRRRWRRNGGETRDAARPWRLCAGVAQAAASPVRGTHAAAGVEGETLVWFAFIGLLQWLLAGRASDRWSL